MFRTRVASSVRIVLLSVSWVLAGSGIAVAQQQQPLPPPPPPPKAAAQDEVDTSAVTRVGGRWELNWRLSDRLPEQAGAPTGGEPGERGGSGGGHRGGGGGGGMGGMGGGMGRGGMGHGGGRGGEGGGEKNVTAMEQARDIIQAQRTLLIVEHPDHVSITDEKGQVQKFVTNGEKTKEELAGHPYERRTHWDGRTLITEVALADGTKITQTYQKAAEGLQLVVTTKIEGGRAAGREFKRVYDQALE